MLAVGAWLSVSDVTRVTIEDFRRSMIELVANPAVIIASGDPFLFQDAVTRPRL